MQPAIHVPLSGLHANDAAYHHVADCYKSIEYNFDVAKSTLDSLYTFYNDNFVFRDAALTPNLALPFTSAPVDVLDGLQKIGGKKYNSDLDFQADMQLLAYSLNDAQFNYNTLCYGSIGFKQPISLYAPVVNGRQSIRVFKDATDNYFTDCEVLEIDGKGTTSFLQPWADKKTGYSKGAGVRLNNVLVYQTYDKESQTWTMNSGVFTERNTLPETALLLVRAKRVARDPISRPYPKSIGNRNQSFPVENEFKVFPRREVLRREFEEKQQAAIRKRAERGEAYPVQDFLGATFVAGNRTAVYQLKSKPHVGILVVPTMEFVFAERVNEASIIQGYLTELAQRNFSPRTLPCFTSAALADADLKNVNYSSYFDLENLTDGVTKKPYKTHLFLGGANLTRNGRVAEYTKNLYLDYSLDGVDQTVRYPWSGDVNKITLLMGGQCASTCGMFSDHLVSRHGVKAVAIGGYSKKDLSMFSYPGASDYGLDYLVDDFKNLAVSPTLQRLP
ncbi:hypothetical protein BGX28_004484 [Mortierella sp. GBA30]|nr:hypothetical protein BGX28_004484 [Mortierella sp. GBA30]